MGEFVRHVACQTCGSSDGRSIYEDESSYCFVCLTYEPPPKGNKNAKPKQTRSVALELVDGRYADIPKRGLREATCRRFKYQIGEDRNGKPIHIANYCDAAGRVVAQKIRNAGKQFRWVGDRSEALPLYGQHLWNGGKSLVITEGEIDALSFATAFDNKSYPVVSLPDGAPAAVRAVKQAYEWITGFERIILCFDNDKQGQEATRKVAELLPVGRVSIMRLGRKDANDVLVNDGAAPLTAAFWNAAEWRPDGIVSGKDLWSTIVETKDVASIPYPWSKVTEITGGLRRSELVTLCAGSGIGKSYFAREVAYSLLMRGEKVGMLMLEESTTRTALGLMGLALNKPIHIKKDEVQEDELKRAFDKTVGSGRLYLYDHFGSTDVDNLLNKVRYMAKALGCTHIVLDHLSIVVSSMEGGQDERKLIDRAMTLLRTLVQETGICLVVVSHLRRPEGRGHENGRELSLSDLRGSASIGQLSDIVIGLERNQQDPTTNDQTTLRVLKNRFSGDTGEAGVLFYDKTTGRSTESSFGPSENTAEVSELSRSTGG